LCFNITDSYLSINNLTLAGLKFIALDRLVASGGRMDSVGFLFKKAINQSIPACSLSVQFFGTFKLSFREKSKANFLIVK